MQRVDAAWTQRPQAIGGRAKGVVWLLLGLALLVGFQATVDRYAQVGRPFAGFSVMEDLLVGAGGAERGGLQPFDLVRTMNGRVLTSGRAIQDEITRHPPGTRFHYIVYRRGELVEADVVTRLVTRTDFMRFLLEGLLGGLLLLGLGAVVFALKPGVPRSGLFLAFCLISYLLSVTYADSHSTYRFTRLFLSAWAFSPAVFIHLALTFPQRRRLVRRFPGVVWLPYVPSAIVGGYLQLGFRPGWPARMSVIASIGAAYWGLALILLVLALAKTSLAGAAPLMRQRARVMTAAFAVGYLPPVLGTAVEVMFRVPVPYLREIWNLHFVFPAVMAYAMARYDLFDVRTALRIGTIYSTVTGLVVLAYAGAIAVLDLAFQSLELSTSPVIVAAVLALGVVLFLNPFYVKTQKVVDRLFFRQRFDVEQSLERVSEVMTSLLDLDRIVELMIRTVEEVLHPMGQSLLLADEAGQGFATTGDENGGEEPRTLPRDSPLPTCLTRVRGPVTRERIEEDPALRDLRDGCLAEMDTLKAALIVPVLFQERLTGVLTLGPKRSGAAYSTQDLRLLRLLVNQSALALEHARAFAALGAANAQLKAALRRVEILESVRSSLAKFVPRTVQELIEQAPEAPELDKHEADVSVLFVDIVGYTRLSERLDPSKVNDLVERYFGAYLDEILKRGGDVNETAGDGLMVVFQDPDPRRHARAAVKTALAILRRTREINEKLTALDEPIALHVSVNSGLATVGATKIEGVAGTRWTYTASGHVTNVAARLAALGGGDAIVIGPETQSRLRGEFAFEALGERSLRNVEQPVPVFGLRLPASSPAPGVPKAVRA